LIYRGLGDLVLVVHLAFVLFVVLGGLLVLRWPKLAWLHVPAAIWGGEAGYSGGFIQHYIQPVLYPAGLTRSTQIVLGSIALILNIAAYGIVIARMRRGQR
jgi:hypothetical protein